MGSELRWEDRRAGEPLTVEELCERSGAWANGQYRDLATRWAKLHEEVGEAVHAALRLHDAHARDAVTYAPASDLAEELADVALVLASLAHGYGIDLTLHIDYKARERQHG